MSTSTASARVRASDLLRRAPLWVPVLVIGAVLIALMTLLYVGSTVDPVSHMHDLPVAVVNEDQGASVGGRTVNIGASTQHALLSTPAVTDKLGVQAGSLAAAHARMDRADAYATVVIPAHTTSSLLAIGGLAPAAAAGGGEARLPQITILTNKRAGTEGASLATGVLQPALARISQAVGAELAPLVKAHGAPSAAATAVLSDPLGVDVSEYRPLPAHAALGLSAFYASLLVVMCGFIGAVIVNNSLDGELGFAAVETGPKWRQSRPVLISRTQTLLAKWAMAAVVTGVLTGVVLLIAAALLGLDAPQPLLLWLYGWFGAATVSIGTLALIAVLGTPGQLVALLLFVYLGLASAGGTVPVQALPGVLHAVSHADPLRQILAGVRAIVYFEARADAGLREGLIATAIGLVFWLAFGTFFVRLYDRKGLHRLDPDVLAYANRAADEYASARAAQADAPAS